MKDEFESIFDLLRRIYQTHRHSHPENQDSRQMCCMWSTDDPPDIVADTAPFDDVEDAFGISIDTDLALELYDMPLDEAARKIIEIRQEQCRQ